MAINVTSTNATAENISRNQVVSWVNEFVPFPITKVEDLSKGLHYCILMDFLFPRILSSSKLKLSPNQEHQFIHNLKELQNIFSKRGVDKIVPIQKLAKARFQDNYEFAQWFHKFFTANYDPDSSEETFLRHKKMFGVTPSGSAPKSTQRAAPVTSKSVRMAPVREELVPTAKKDSLTKIAQLNEALGKLKEKLTTVEGERDYYYGILKGVEALIEGARPEETVTAGELQRVLYEGQEEY